MAEWCQNKRCVDKKNQSQIRGTKGNKYYQSNKARPYYNHMFCGQRCQDQWFNDNWEVCLRAVGEIPKQVLPVDDAWYVVYDYGRYRYDSENQEGSYTDRGWFLKNNNRGVKQMITQEQAQTPEQIQANWKYDTITDAQARELAVTLGLAS